MKKQQLKYIDMWNTYPAIECMQHRMSSPISYTARAVSLSTFSEIQTLTSKCTLIDFAVVHSTEGHANVLQLTYNDSTN